MADRSLLSTKSIAPQDRLIFALDVPTKADALAWIDRLGTAVNCCTLHGVSSIYAGAVPVKGAMKLLAVTVLTSLDASDIAELGWSGTAEDLVSMRARRAVEAGIDGLICSGQEASRLRRELGHGPLIITPGIRAANERGSDDQKRTMSLEEAFLAGADHIVVGRPIRNAPDPRAAAQAMQDEIARLFSA